MVGGCAQTVVAVAVAAAAAVRVVCTEVQIHRIALENPGAAEDAAVTDTALAGRALAVT